MAKMGHFLIKNTFKLLSVFALATFVAVHADDKIIGGDSFKPSCNLLQRELREIQKKQFGLKSAGTSVFELHKKHDALTAELAIVQGILNLKSDFRNHRKAMFDTPLTELKEAAARLDEGTVMAGKMHALESFINELQGSPEELAAAIKKIKGDASSDPTSEEVIMGLAEEKCKVSPAPAFCQVLTDEATKASGLATKVTSILGGDDKRPIYRTLREFSKTFQVLGASEPSETVTGEKLTEFEALLKQGEAFDPALYYGEMKDLMDTYKNHSQKIAQSIGDYEKCTSEARALGDNTKLQACVVTTEALGIENEALLTAINQKYSDSEFIKKHKLSLDIMNGELRKVLGRMPAADKANENVAGMSEESAAKYNEVLLSSLEKMECVHGSLKRRGIKGTPEDYFKNNSTNNQAVFQSLKGTLLKVAPQCQSTIEAVGDMDKLKTMGTQISDCVDSLSDKNLAAIQSDVEGLKREQALLKTQIAEAEAGSNYKALEDLKTFVAMRFQQGKCLEELQARSETIIACDKSNIDVGFKSIARLSDSAGQIIAEYQHSLIGAVESRQGEREYAGKLSSICKSPDIVGLNLSTCHSVNLYREIVTQPTQLERNQKNIEEKDVTYDPVAQKKVIRDRKPVVSDPLVLNAATRNIFGLGTAYIQGNNAYTYGMIDANQRLNMQWTQYRLNQYFANNPQILSGTWQMGYYPFSLSSPQNQALNSYYSTN